MLRAHSILTLCPTHSRPLGVLAQASLRTAQTGTAPSDRSRGPLERSLSHPNFCSSFSPPTFIVNLELFLFFIILFVFSCFFSLGLQINKQIKKTTKKDIKKKNRLFHVWLRTWSLIILMSVRVFLSPFKDVAHQDCSFYRGTVFYSFSLYVSLFSLALGFTVTSLHHCAYRPISWPEAPRSPGLCCVPYSCTIFPS